MYAIISHNDSKYQPLADLTWNENKIEYATRHGYAVYNKTDEFLTTNEKTVMTGFEKIYLTKEIMQEYPEVEWIWFTGTDTMITNFSTKIEDRIDNNYHFIVAVDVNGINADSYLIRNTPEGMSFIDHVLSLKDTCDKHWDTEQRAFCYALGFPGTGEPGWPFGETLVVCEQFRKIVKIVPQRYMNSFNYGLYHYTDHRDKLGVNGNWSFGDWLIHWPACSVEHRINLYNTYKDQIVR
jgi:hypothetical protein